MSVFNFSKRPSQLVFLDDDALFLDVIGLVLPKSWRAQFFLNAQLCLDFLQANTKAWHDDFWVQRKLLEQAQHSVSTIPSIVQYWRDNPRRYDLVQLIAVDYAMPSMNGLDVLRTLNDFVGSRVLLTGQADEVQALKAFNQGLIDQFIAKQSMDLRAHLVEHLQPLMNKPTASYQSLWGQDLSQQQQSLLSDPVVAEALQRWIAGQDWIEYVLTIRPFGILGVNATGRVSWLQLERVAELEDLVELVSDEALPTEDIASVLRGDLLLNAELCLGLEDLPLAFSRAFHLSDQLLAAVYDLGDAYALNPDQSYAGWCQR
jgi:CheY-like chemotaxis protein